MPRCFWTASALSAKPQGFPPEDKRASLTCCWDNWIMSLQSPSVPLLSLFSGHSFPDEEFPQSTVSKASWMRCICAADKTLQQRSHSSISATIITLAWKLVSTLAIYCPCTYTPLYSPIILHGYQTNNTKLNNSLGVAFFSLVGNVPVGIMEDDEMESFELLPSPKRKVIRHTPFFLLYKAKLFFFPTEEKVFNHCLFST